jgi:tetratricopeptide (TPR) repeat protein
MAVITFNPSRSLRSQKSVILASLALAAALGLAGCETTNTSDAVIRIDKAQGSQENIASLTAVINANPRDPEGYNVRGSAYGRGGEFRKALDDFNTALQINPRFFQAYANRALVYRNMGQQPQAIAD